MITRVVARPNQLDLDSPGRRDYWVALEHDSIWGDHLIPLTVWVGPRQAGRRPGRVRLESWQRVRRAGRAQAPARRDRPARRAGTHHFHSRPQSLGLSGRHAREHSRRSGESQSGLRRRRGASAGALRHHAPHRRLRARAGLAARARRSRSALRRQRGPVFDLRNYHHVDDPVLAAKIEQTARWFGTPSLMVYQNLTPGLLPSEAERLGKITVGTELGWGSAVNPEGVRYGRQGVLAAAIHQGQLAGTIEPIAHHKAGTQRKLEMVDRACFTVAPFDGHYESVLECGTRVKTGDVVGYLHDFDHIDMEPWPARPESTAWCWLRLGWRPSHAASTSSSSAARSTKRLSKSRRELSQFCAGSSFEGFDRDHANLPESFRKGRRPDMQQPGASPLGNGPSRIPPEPRRGDIGGGVAGQCPVRSGKAGSNAGPSRYAGRNLSWAGGPKTKSGVRRSPSRGDAPGSFMLGRWPTKLLPRLPCPHENLMGQVGCCPRLCSLRSKMGLPNLSTLAGRRQPTLSPSTHPGMIETHDA